MRKTIKGVSIRVHPLFFDKVFEVNRKALEGKIKKPLTQIEFTGILAQGHFKINLKKFDMKFGPKQIKKKRSFIL